MREITERHIIELIKKFGGKSTVGPFDAFVGVGVRSGGWGVGEMDNLTDHEALFQYIISPHSNLSQNIYSDTLNDVYCGQAIFLGLDETAPGPTWMVSVFSKDYGYNVGDLIGYFFEIKYQKLTVATDSSNPFPKWTQGRYTGSGTLKNSELYVGYQDIIDRVKSHILIEEVENPINSIDFSRDFGTGEILELNLEPYGLTKQLFKMSVAKTGTFGVGFVLVVTDVQQGPHTCYLTNFSQNREDPYIDDGGDTPQLDLTAFDIDETQIFEIG